MIEKEDNFNEFLKQKVEESHFEYNDSYWLKAEKLIENTQPKRKPFWFGFGWGVFSVALIGGIAALVLNNNKQSVAKAGQDGLAKENSIAIVQKAELKNAELPMQSEQDIALTSEKTALVNAKKRRENNPSNASFSKNNNQEKSYQNITLNKNRKSNKNTSNTVLLASSARSAQSLADSYFNPVKNLSAPKLPESLVNINDENEEQEKQKVITIAEPFILNAKTSSIKDIDVNIVAACENKHTHEWMFNVLAGVSDSRGFEGNTVTSSRIGFGYFGGFRLAYKLNKNWFVGVQPLFYSRGAINTSIETEKTDYDFGANADEFIVKNKALLFAEMPVSIGYRVQRHQISVGAGLEYLVNVKSDVKEFGTTDYTPNQWGYTDGFNRFGTIAIFNYAFNVYNEFWLTMMVQKGFTDLTKADYFTTNSKDKNFNLRIGLQYQFNNQKKKGK
jgi:hypothetical protein